MAKQTSIITLTGKVGGLTVYKTKDGHMAKEKGGVPLSRIMTDPRYARTRENMREFAEAAAAVKAVKEALRPAFTKLGGSKLHGRMQSIMVKVVKSDPVNSRGERKAAEGDWTLFHKFELNGATPLSATLKAEYTVTDTPTAFSVAFEEFRPIDDLVIPPGATHFRLSAQGISVDLATGGRSLVKTATPAVPIGDLVESFTLEVGKAGLEEAIRMYVLGIEFIQEVNGEEYALNDGAHNSASVVYTEKVA